MTIGSLRASKTFADFTPLSSSWALSIPHLTRTLLKWRTSPSETRVSRKLTHFTAFSLRANSEIGLCLMHYANFLRLCFHAIPMCIHPSLAFVSGTSMYRHSNSVNATSNCKTRTLPAICHPLNREILCARVESQKSGQRRGIMSMQRKESARSRRPLTGRAKKWEIQSVRARKKSRSR